MYVGHLYNTTDYICFVISHSVAYVANKVEAGTYLSFHHGPFYYSILNFSWITLDWHSLPYRAVFSEVSILGALTLWEDGRDNPTDWGS